MGVEAGLELGAGQIQDGAGHGDGLTWPTTRVPRGPPNLPAQTTQTFPVMSTFAITGPRKAYAMCLRKFGQRVTSRLEGVDLALGFRLALDLQLSGHGKLVAHRAAALCSEPERSSIAF